MNSVPAFINNKQAYGLLIDVIKSWQNKKKWIFQQENLFLDKLAYIYPNPAIEGEVFIVFEVRDHTMLVDNILDIYSHKASFQTSALSNPNLNSNGDIERLKVFLDNLDNTTITEREQELTNYGSSGKKIESTNPYLWKN